MAELTSVTIQLREDYEKLLADYQLKKAAYEARIPLTANAQKVVDKGAVYINGVTRYGEWIPLLASYKEIESRFKVNMEVAQQNMIRAKNAYLTALEKENPKEYAAIKTAESREAFAKQFSKIAIITIPLIIIVLVIIAIKKGWFKRK